MAMTATARLPKRSPARCNSPGLDLPEVFQRVRESVLAATEERQTPWDSSSLVKSFYFVPPKESLAKDDLVADADAPAPVQVADARVADNQPAPAAESALRQTESLAPDHRARQRRAQSHEQRPDPVFVAMTRSLFAKAGSRLRAEPSTDASVVAKLPANAEIRAVALSKDGDWYEVATKQGRTAYIHADAVSAFRAAKPKLYAAPTQTAALSPKPVAAVNGAKAKTGIGMVDQALNWLSSNAPASGGTAPVTRASR